jgi:hypothetical protein
MAKNERLNYDLEIDEGSTPTLAVLGADSAGAAILPSAIDNIYIKIDDYFSDTVIKASTDLGKTANPVSYALTETETRIINIERAFEYRFVTIDFVYNTTGHITKEYILKINNLKYHTV